MKASTVLEGLLAVKEAAISTNRPQWFKDTTGICDNLDEWEIRVNEEYSCEASLYLDLFFNGWDEWSGCDVFPVPSKEEYLTAQEMYMSNRFSMWTGEYGAARLRLLDYLIQSVEALGDSEIGFGEE